MKIVVYPSKNKSNKYIDIIVGFLDARKLEVISLQEMFYTIKTFFSVKFVHLNWYENLEGKGSFVKVITFVKKILRLILLKILRRKIIWTMHNKIPHDRSSFLLQYILLYLLVTFSYKIIIHSNISRDILFNSLKLNRKKDNKIVYIPHPNYIDVYGSQLKDETLNNRINLLFIGAVKPYKNIELLIDVVKNFPDLVDLTIAGFCKSSSYKIRIEEYVQKVSTNIKLDFRFIEDEEIPLLMSKHDLIILPYDKISSLNSGTVILAFSYGKTVICPVIGTIQDLPNRDNVFSYDYNDENDHYEKLYEELKKAIDMWKKDPLIYSKMGNAMKKNVEICNNNNMIARMFYNLYIK